jgi:hypothetical protein
MPHEAFTLVDVVRSSDTEGEKLTALTYLGETLYIGTASGRLQQYRVTSSRSANFTSEYASTRERTMDVGSSRQPVTQIEAVPDIGLLIALCDGCISLHRLANLDRTPSGVLDSKHAVAFSVNSRGRKLCIATNKKRLKLYEWVDGKFAPMRSHPELDIPDVPRSLAYYGPRICLGYQREYNVLFEDTGEVREIGQSMGRETRSYIKLLPGDALVVVCANDTGVVINGSTGDPSVLATMSGGRANSSTGAGAAGIAILQFRHKPLAIGYCFPYVVSVGDGQANSGVNGSKVEVHSGRGGKDELVQVLPLPAGSGSVVALADGRVGATSKMDVDAMDSTSRGRNPVYIAFGNPGRVMRLQPVPVDKQVEDMLRQFFISSAVDLICSTCPADPPSLLANRLSRLNVDAGRVLFLGLHFEQAYSFLTASTVDPREVLQMFPDLLIGATTLLLQPSSEKDIQAAAGRRDGEVASVAGSFSKQQQQQKYIEDSFDDLDVDEGVGEEGVRSSSTLSNSRYAPYPSRYFSVSLTQGIASGFKQPSEAASEAADAVGTSIATMMASAQSGDRNRGGVSGGVSENGAAGGEFGFNSIPGRIVTTGVADIAFIVKGQFASYVTRMQGAHSSGGDDETASNADLRINAATNITTASMNSSSTSRISIEKDRVIAAYSGLLPFLLSRRKAVQSALIKSRMGSGVAYSSNTLGLESESGLTRSLPGHTVQIVRGKGGVKKFSSISSAYSASTLTLSELITLASVVDGALLRLFAALEMPIEVDRLLLCRTSMLDAEDTVLFLKSQGRFRSLALFFAAGRGGGGNLRDALGLWRSLGTDSLVEREDVFTLSTSNGGSSVSSKGGSTLNLSTLIRMRSKAVLSSSSRNRNSDDEDSGEIEVSDVIDDALGDLSVVFSHPAFSEANSVLPSDVSKAPSPSIASAASAAVSIASSYSTSNNSKNMELSSLSVGGEGGGGGVEDGRDSTSTSLLAVSFACLALGIKPDGVADTIATLRGCSDLPLVFEFSTWLLMSPYPKPRQAMAIFTHRHTSHSNINKRSSISGNNVSKSSESVPEDAVLEFLSAQKFSDISRRSPGLSASRMYLEHLVYRCARTDERYHTRLGREYISNVMKLRGSDDDTLSSATGSASMSTLLSLRGSANTRPAPGSEGGLLGALRARLLFLLQNSNMYDSRELLALIRDSTLYEERVILCGRNGFHRQALSLLINELADPDRAVTYCDLIVKSRGVNSSVTGAINSSSLMSAFASSSSTSSNSSSSSSSTSSTMSNGGGSESVEGDPFLSLLRLYLDAHSQHVQANIASKANRSQASTASTATDTSSNSSSSSSSSSSSVYLTRSLGILSKHANSLDALLTAKLLPSDLPLFKVLDYLSQVVPASTHSVRESAIVKNLYNYRYLEVNDSLISSQDRSTTVTRSTCCHICDKRIGDNVFATLPDLRPVHFHCSRDLSAFSLSSSSSLNGGGRSTGQGVGNLTNNGASDPGLSRLHVYDDSIAKRDDGLLSPLPAETFAASTASTVTPTLQFDVNNHSLLLDVNQYVTVKSGGGGAVRR